jgi:hypothetical protein
MSDVFHFWGSITRVDTLLRAEMTVEKGRWVLGRKILVGIVDTQFYLLTRSIEKLYRYNKLLNLTFFLFYGRLGKYTLSR